VSISTPQEAIERLNEVCLWLGDVIKATKPVEAVPVLPKAPVGLQRPARFYDYIRGDEGELFPVMRETQMLGIEAILAAAAGKLPLSWCAYVLGSVYHETGKRMIGVKEGFDVSDAWRKKNLRYYPWYGRGPIQITWEENYKKATKRLNELGYNVDLIANPDKALELEVGAAIAVIGCLEGWFTGKKLRDYLPAQPDRENYRNARRIVNLMDKADLIAGYAIEFEKGLKAGDWQ